MPDDKQDRLVTGDIDDLNEATIEKSLRPRRLETYIGLDRVKQLLTVYITAAQTREESLELVLLYGPPGRCKTTLALVIAHEMGVNIRTTSGPAIEKPGDLVALLNELRPGDVLFVDEILRLHKIVEEMLYSAMEDFYIDIVVGQGPTAHPVLFPLPPFTLIGANTRAGMLSAPLRDRFGISEHMAYYSPDDLSEIVKRSANVLHMAIDAEGAYEIARRSRGTPRVAHRLLKRIRDFAEVAGQSPVDLDMVELALELLQVDATGLELIDRQLLTYLIRDYTGGPVGLYTIAAHIGEEMATIEEMYEPVLLTIGFLKRTPRGRMVTPAGFAHMGMTMPTSTDEQSPYKKQVMK